MENLDYRSANKDKTLKTKFFILMFNSHKLSFNNLTLTIVYKIEVLDNNNVTEMQIVFFSLMSQSYDGGRCLNCSDSTRLRQ